MTKKDVQSFDKLIIKTFKGKQNSFEEIIKVCANLAVQENSIQNQELMDRVMENCNQTQASEFLDHYFNFANLIVEKIEQFENMPDEKQYAQMLKAFVKNILTVIPQNKWQDHIMASFEYLTDVINNEYSLYDMSLDDFEKKLIEKFAGVTPMAELYALSIKIIGENELNPTKKTKVELLQLMEILVSFIIFSNITRKTVMMKGTKQLDSVNSTEYDPNYETNDNRIYQLKISIKGAKPPIWRRVLVEANISFYGLHMLIQEIFNWENYHMYQFDGNFGNYSDEEFIDEEYGYNNKKNYPTENIRISQDLINEKDKVKYTYDFGDDWEHEIVLEKILDYDDNINYPICTAGRRNGPIEDCGGIWGYSDIVYAIENKDFTELEHLFDDGEFYYEDFDPSYFNKNEINDRLHRR